MQDIQQLPFIHVEPLDLNIENRGRIRSNVIFLFDERGKLFFFCAFDRRRPFQERAVLRPAPERSQLRRMQLPVRTDRFVNQIGELRICFQKPAPVADSVRFVVEFSGVKFMEILQLLVL